MIEELKTLLKESQEYRKEIDEKLFNPSWLVENHHD